jgi:hypothetical protein
MTPQERQRVFELVEAGRANGASIEETVRSIAKEMPHLTTAEVVEACRVHKEELRLGAAVYLAEAQASKRIAEIIEETGESDVGGTLDALATRSARGDHRAAELLRELEHTLAVASMDD